MAAKAEKQCRLVRGEIHDFMKLRFVDLRFGDDPITVIAGDNEQGKTSVLRAFVALLGGKEASPEKPIREGAESAQVLGELDNGLVIRRRWTKTGNSYVDVQTKEGATFKSPQKILDDLVGRFSLDPLAFDRMDPKKQAETLRKIAGVDLAPFDAKRQEAYNSRTLGNRDVEQLKARLASLPEVDAPDEIVAAADLLAEHERRQKEKRANDLARNDLERLREIARARKRDVENVTAEAVRQREQLAATEQRQAGAEKALEDALQRGREAGATAAALVDPDMDEIPKKLRDVEAMNDRVRAKRQRASVAADLAAALEKAKRLDEAVAAADAEKAEALSAAKFPVDGLGFDAEGVTVDAIPYKQTSKARRTRISMAMALALRPRLPLICIEDGSMLDEKARAVVREMATQAGAQILLELVGKGAGGVVIEDGVVEGAPAPSKARS